MFSVSYENVYNNEEKLYVMLGYIMSREKVKKKNSIPLFSLIITITASVKLKFYL
jgi:hypothetical protein